MNMLVLLWILFVQINFFGSIRTEQQFTILVSTFSACSGRFDVQDRDVRPAGLPRRQTRGYQATLRPLLRIFSDSTLPSSMLIMRCAYSACCWECVTITIVVPS